MDPLTVSLGPRSYPICLGQSLRTEVRQEVDAAIREGRKVAVVTDRRVAESQADLLRAMLGGVPQLALELLQLAQLLLSDRNQPLTDQ